MPTLIKNKESNWIGNVMKPKLKSMTTNILVAINLKIK